VGNPILKLIKIMDAFAGRQIEKRKAAEEKEKMKESLSMKKLELSFEEKVNVNRQFGILDPPLICFAAGM
jgi:hypothetical protein